MCAILLSKALRLARVNTGSRSFTCHPSICRMSRLAFTPQPQSITALWPVLVSRPVEGRRLSWPRWLGEILRWFARPKTVTHPVLAAAAGNRTRDHRVAVPTPEPLDYTAPPRCGEITSLSPYTQRCSTWYLYLYSSI